MPSRKEKLEGAILCLENNIINPRDLNWLYNYIERVTTALLWGANPNKGGFDIALDRQARIVKALKARYTGSNV